ncbi:MAG: hypothetical protein RSB35_02480 [Eubacterium sp.]
MEENKWIVDEFMELAIIIMKEFDLTRPEAIEVAKAVIIKQTILDQLDRWETENAITGIKCQLENIAQGISRMV